jgi:hypothetical protein
MISFKLSRCCIGTLFSICIKSEVNEGAQNTPAREMKCKSIILNSVPENLCKILSLRIVNALIFLVIAFTNALSGFRCFGAENVKHLFRVWLKI